MSLTVRPGSDGFGVSSFLAAAVQLTSTPDPDVNFAAAEEQTELAARRGADLVGLPEHIANEQQYRRQ